VTGKTVSKQQVLVVAVFIVEPQQWHESREIEYKTGVPGSTVRHLLLILSTLGILERSEVLGGYRYRLSVAAQEQPYFGRLQEAAAIMQT
jgi:DNA-binding IclR family transcriptional regulator